MTALRATSDVLIGGWSDDRRLALLPDDPDYDGWVLEWVGRSAGAASQPRLWEPARCVVRPIDQHLLDRCRGRDAIVSHLGGIERFFTHGFGFCLLTDDMVACEVFACPVAQGRREIWVETHAPYRRRGYATVTCAYALQACEAAGQQPYWNTAQQNQASIALAHRLGFGEGRAYRLLGWTRQAR
jgi:RimJ/RimL family protein N-acetyltransferase